ncbi:MAG: S1 RNA-binding domain-containing protein [Chloroflexota bacterium]
MSNPEATTQEVKRKMQFTGKVVKTTLAGAVVDIGQKKPGVIHIAHMGQEAVKRVEDVLQAGQEVNVWVRRVKKDANHIELTMMEPLQLEWREIKKGMVIKGEVVRIEKFGAFIEIGAERPGLAHISELTHDYIRTPEDAVKVGEEVEVKVIDFSRRKKQIKLSLKALSSPPAAIIEAQNEIDAGPTLTAMEDAYRRALEKNDEPEGASEEGGDSETDTTQEEIISRTLEHKTKSK